MENRVRERALFLLLTEKIDLDEVSINWLEKLPIIGKAFAKERGDDERTGDEPTQDPKITKVNIPLPIPDEEKATILKNSEVQNLLKAFFARWNVSSGAAKNAFMKAIQLDPTNTIKRYTLLAAVDNVATKGDEKSKAINPDNPDDPTGPGEQNLKQKAKEVANVVAGDEKLIQFIDKAIENFVKEKYTGRRKPQETWVRKRQDAINLIKKQINDLFGGMIKENTISNFSSYTKAFIHELHPLLVQEQLAITNLSETDIAELVNEINKFYPYAKEYLGFDRPVELTLISDPDNAKDTFGKTAYYSPKNEQMTIFVDGRHPKDIIRSFSHELVHHAQNCRGEFDRDFSVGENYIETDDHLKEMEREAYDKGNMCLRTYESYLKKENKTMNEETLRNAIREAIKRVVENKTEAVKETTTEEITEATEETVVTEDSGEEEAWHQWKNEHADDDHIKEIEHHLRALRHDRDHERDEAEYDHDKYEDEGMEEAADKNDGLENPSDEPEHTSYGHMKEETLEETGAEKTGASKGDKGKDKEDPKDRDYSGHGMRKGDESDTHPGEKDDTTKKDDELKHSGKGRGEKKGDKAYVNEEETTTSLNESMAVKKGQLVFDKLVKKWCK